MKTKRIADILPEFQKSPPMLLDKFTDLSKAPPGEPWDSIREMYLENSWPVRIAGMIANGVITEKKVEFLFSARILAKMLKKNFDDYSEYDPESGMLPFSGQNYKRVLAKLTAQTGFMICIEPPSKFKGNDSKAGKYRISYQPILEQLEKSHQESHLESHQKSLETESEIETEIE